MSCEQRRRLLWRRALRLTPAMEDEVETIYRQAGESVDASTVTPVQKAQWLRKYKELKVLFLHYGITPPGHSAVGAPPRTAKAQAGYAAVKDWLQERGLVCAKRRRGLPPRQDGGWETGQMCAAEYKFFQELAQARQKPIFILAGSLVETDLGLGRRYDPTWQRYLPAWRRCKPRSTLVDDGRIRDVDVGSISGLTPAEVELIRSKLQELTDTPVEIDAEGYSAGRYPTLETFVECGALCFHPDGQVQRIPAPWQLPEWETQND